MSPSISPDLSVIVPFLDEEENLPGLITRVRETLDATSYDWELVLVDDGSTDRGPAIVECEHSQDSRIKMIQLMRNFGQEAAVGAGLEYAKGALIVQMDADLQNPPEEIPRLLEEMSNGYDVVWGYRTKRKDPFLRRLASRLLVGLMETVFNIQLPQDVTTFRVMTKDVARFISSLPEKKKFFSALIVWSGVRSTGVEVAHAARTHGETKYSFPRLVNHTWDLIVGFSIRPLQLTGVLGLFIALVGIGFAGFQVFQRLMGVPFVLGYTSIIAAILTLGGLQLITLSVIGEYIGRIFLQVQDRPRYLIARALGCDVKR